MWVVRSSYSFPVSDGKQGHLHFFALETFAGKRREAASGQKLLQCVIKYWAHPRNGVGCAGEEWYKESTFKDKVKVGESQILRRVWRPASLRSMCNPYPAPSSSLERHNPEGKRPLEHLGKMGVGSLLWSTQISRDHVIINLEDVRGSR